MEEATSRSPLRRRLLPCTGLMPVLPMVPVLAFNLYAVAIVLGIVSGTLVIAYHLRQGQGVTSLDVLVQFTRRVISPAA
jgi:prolipoprotein diacylglyceryltransferase